jgi:hypothetical protein
MLSFFYIKTPAVDLVFVSSLATFMHGSVSVPLEFCLLDAHSLGYYLSIVKRGNFYNRNLIRNLTRNLEQGYGSGFYRVKMIRFRFLHGQNDAVPAVPVLDP